MCVKYNPLTPFSKGDLMKSPLEKLAIMEKVVELLIKELYSFLN